MAKKQSPASQSTDSVIVWSQILLVHFRLGMSNNCLRDVKLSWIAIYRYEFRRMNRSLNWSFIRCGELHCDSVQIKTMINSSLFFLRQRESFGLERLFCCFVIGGYSLPEERSCATNWGVFLIFTVFSGRRFWNAKFYQCTWRGGRTIIPRDNFIRTKISWMHW